MRIEKVTIVDARKNDEVIVFGPIDGGKSAIIIGDEAKNTLLKGISFALGHSNEMDSISSEFNDFIGFVEVTFTKVKSLFNDIDPNQMQDRLCIRRSVHANQISYTIDGVHAERVDVKNLLQTYGFADNFPLQYSIQCHDITSIEMSNATDRLQWLKNCCGVDEYYAKRNKSMRVLRETEDNIRKIDASLEKIDVQLSIYGSNEKQQIYHRIVSREKELGHLQRQYRVKKIRSQLEQLDVNMSALSNRIASVQSDVIQCTNNVTVVRREIKSILERIQALKTNEHQLQHGIDEYERAKVELVEYISSLQNAIEKGAMAEDLTTHEKHLYEEKIDETRTRMSEFDARIDAIDEKKKKAELELAELERQAEAIVLNCQQNQRIGAQFQTTEQRNEYLQGLIKRTKNAISRENRKRNKMIAELQLETKKLENLKATAEKYNQRLSEMNAKEESDTFYRQQEMISNLENQKFELIEQSEQLAEKSQELKSSLEQVYDELRSQIGDAIFNGITSMKMLLQKGLANGFRKQYFGLVIENFTCKNPSVPNSMAALMGEYLFYHIVDTSNTAARIIFEFNKANLPGEVNFFVLDIIAGSDWDNRDSSISRFCFDAKFQKVFEKIFHEMPMNVQSMWSKSAADVDANSLASLLPDVIEKDGALTATNSALNSANNSIDLYEKHQNLLELDEATRYELSENSYRMDATLCSIDETSTSLGKRYNTITAIENIESCLAQTNHQIKLCESHIATVQTEVQRIEIKVQELADTNHRYENELKSDQLLHEEKMATERVQVLINAKKMELVQINAEIKKVTASRDVVTQFFDQTLMSRYSAIKESAKKYSDATNELNCKEQERLRNAENQLNAEADLNAVRLQIVDWQTQHNAKKITLRDLDELKSNLHQRQEQLFIEVREMEIVKKNLAKELSQLVSIKPPDATVLQNPDIVDMPEADVISQLDIARHQLKTYQSTNSFDINILEKFKRDRANFVRRRTGLATFGAKISKAMESLDSNIHTSIESTFDDLAKHFAAIFERFVPNGSARLQSIKLVKNDLDLNTDCSGADISNMAGIEIFARFPHEIEQPFDDLFGLKRRVLSLAFILCMQQVYPAPFYLCNCIDESFFGQHLMSLISYLNELSNKAQIIITTNRQSSLNGLSFINDVVQPVFTQGNTNNPMDSQNE